MQMVHSYSEFLTSTLRPVVIDFLISVSSCCSTGPNPSVFISFIFNTAILLFDIVFPTVLTGNVTDQVPEGIPPLLVITEFIKTCTAG